MADQNKCKELHKLLPNSVSFDTKDLNAHAGDLWPKKLLRERLKEKIELPLAVVTPESPSDIQKIVKWANKEKVSIVPYGAGSGVCGAAQACSNAITLDLRHLNRVLKLNQTSQYVTAEAGIMGPALENELNKNGFTLNHFPASFHISTLGGWISTRASGQFSTAYGSIEDMLLGVSAVLPSGEILTTPLTPRAATGPSLRELFLGSEGSFGIITNATCQIHKLPDKRQFLAFEFSDIKVALDSIRSVIQLGIPPTVVRLYDEADTQLAAAQMNIELKRLLLVLMFQGETELVETQMKLTKKHVASNGKELGADPGKHWWEHRFDLNDKRMKEILSQEGMILDTIEVSATWDKLFPLYENMKSALSSDITLLAHFSHFYLTGGSIYFTFVGNVEESKSLETYDRVWNNAMEACIKSKCTISHHHGIGLLKREWFQKDQPKSVEVLTTIKNALDPNHILNPNKCI